MKPTEPANLDLDQLKLALGESVDTWRDPMRRRSFILLAPLLTACAMQRAALVTVQSQSAFADLLNRLADGWNSGDAEVAAGCFTHDAIYVEPPQKQVYAGRAALFQFFGGDSGRAGAMHMRWHRVVFDAQKQQGMGEFTFRYGSQVHGVAIIDLRGSLISQWREYWYSSEQPFDKFVAPSRP